MINVILTFLVYFWDGNGGFRGGSVIVHKVLEMGKIFDIVRLGTSWDSVRPKFCPPPTRVSAENGTYARTVAVHTSPTLIFNNNAPLFGVTPWRTASHFWILIQFSSLCDGPLRVAFFSRAFRSPAKFPVFYSGLRLFQFPRPPNFSRKASGSAQAEMYPGLFRSPHPQSPNIAKTSPNSERPIGGLLCVSGNNPNY